MIPPSSTPPHSSPLTKHALYDFFHKHFAHCGCGCPEEVATLIRTVLIGMKGGNHGSPYDTLKDVLPGVYGDKDNYAEWFLLYQLDNAGLLEHGGNIRGSWLTPLGKKVVAALELYDDWLLLTASEVDFIDEDGKPATFNGVVVEDWDKGETQ